MGARSLVSNSQPALLGLRRFGRGSSLALETREVVRTFEGYTDEFWVWWTLSHAGLLEIDLVDEAAKATAHGIAPGDVCEFLLCKAALNTQIAGHYSSQATTQ